MIRTERLAEVDESEASDSVLKISDFHVETSEERRFKDV